MPYPFFQNYPTYNQAMLQQQLQNMQQTQTPQIQNNGIIPVRSIDEARNYPVAPGNSVTFKNESQPYIYTKTLGFSQLDQPIFEVFKLTKEEETTQVISQVDPEPIAEPAPEYFLLSDAEQLISQFEVLSNENECLRNTLNNLNEQIKYINEQIKLSAKEDPKK